MPILCVLAVDVPQVAIYESNCDVCAMIDRDSGHISVCYTLSLKPLKTNPFSSGLPSYSTVIQIQPKKPGGVLMACHSVLSQAPRHTHT